MEASAVPNDVRAGRTLVVGDVHGCAGELAALLIEAKASRVILAGDLFTKGPDPAGVWDLIRRFNLEAVLGNHDAAVLAEPDRWRAKGLPQEALDWLGNIPLWIDGPGWRVLHAGCDPERGAEATPRTALLNLRRWPNDSDKGHPFWWQLYQGPPMIVFGHDARRGLVDRRPHSLGLDTGCVYGGGLTGVILETGEILQTPSHRVHCPVS